MYYQTFRAKMFPGFAVFFLGIFTLSVTVSCEKKEGLGGTGSISGSITEQFQNDDFSLLISEKPAVDEESEKVTLSFELSISSLEQVVDLGEIVIEKL